MSASNVLLVLPSLSSHSRWLHCWPSAVLDEAGCGWQVRVPAGSVDVRAGIFLVGATRWTLWSSEWFLRGGGNAGLHKC